MATAMCSRWVYSLQRTDSMRFRERMLTILKNLFLLTIPALLFTFLLLELVFRFVIPAAAPPHVYFDPKEQILRFDVNGPRSGTYTAGNLAQVRGRWRINNFGWNSEIDYNRGRSEKTRVAIIGDSYIESLHPNVEETMPGQLRQQIGDTVDVYSFGISSAPMSQYLHMSRYVTRNFDPDILVFNIVGNDFEQNLCEVGWLLGMMCLNDTGDQITESEIIPYSPSFTRRWARRSSLIRYMVLNLKLGTGAFEAVAGSRKLNVAPVGSMPAPLDRSRVANSIDYILRTIAEENPERAVVFIMDGPRRVLYGEESPELDETAPWKNRMLRDVTSKYGFRFIDLTEEFSRKYEQDGEKFNSEQDYHWNVNGHTVVAAALLETLQDIDVFAP